MLSTIMRRRSACSFWASLLRAQAQLGAHAGADFFHAQRLGDVVGGADVEAGHDVVGLAARAHEDHRDARGGRMRLQAAAGFQAVHAGHDDVEQHQVGLMRWAISRARSPEVATKVW
jgi:hypothetical protein